VLQPHPLLLFSGSTLQPKVLGLPIAVSKAKQKGHTNVCTYHAARNHGHRRHGIWMTCNHSIIQTYTHTHARRCGQRRLTSYLNACFHYPSRLALLSLSVSVQVHTCHLVHGPSVEDNHVIGCVLAVTASVSVHAELGGKHFRARPCVETNVCVMVSPVHTKSRSSSTALQ